jgi:hypothetical protein
MVSVKRPLSLLETPGELALQADVYAVEGQRNSVQHEHIDAAAVAGEL